MALLRKGFLESVNVIETTKEDLKIEDEVPDKLDIFSTVPVSDLFL